MNELALFAGAGTWDSAAKSKRTAQRWAKQCREGEPKSAYYVEAIR